jgi:hypothetical protein
MKHASVAFISANYHSAAQHTHSKGNRKKAKTCITHYKLQTAAALLWAARQPHYKHDTVTHTNNAMEISDSLAKETG